MRPLAPHPVLEFVDGPAVDDTPSLTAWLDAHDGDGRQLNRVGGICIAIEAESRRDGFVIE